ncbi:glycine-rich cell wall structural protein 1.0-like [Salvia hispanica]|uniref:glycine-rich cell wall structural protein 1.0-like n=1 Tax=Salvia hispanica TaxID=49212 RepID=UPI0020091526|nr:glycine-rich cell wall structural protein 1.0-like [Salvia hispanica]
MNHNNESESEAAQWISNFTRYTVGCGWGRWARGLTSLGISDGDDGRSAGGGNRGGMSWGMPGGGQGNGGEGYAPDAAADDASDDGDDASLAGRDASRDAGVTGGGGDTVYGPSLDFFTASSHTST